MVGSLATPHHVVEPVHDVFLPSTTSWGLDLGPEAGVLLLGGLGVPGVLARLGRRVGPPASSRLRHLVPRGDNEGSRVNQISLKYIVPQ